jgi:hypothetical protein
MWFPIQFVDPGSGNRAPILDLYNGIANAAVISVVTILAISVLKCCCGSWAATSFILPALVVLASAEGIAAMVGTIIIVGVAIELFKALSKAFH